MILEIVAEYKVTNIIEICEPDGQLTKHSGSLKPEFELNMKNKAKSLGSEN